MSLISFIETYENKAKEVSTAHIVSQFSGVVVVDYQGSMHGDIQYLVNDYAISFLDVRTTDTNVDVERTLTRAWALPGYIIEGVRESGADPVIKIPTLPLGTISTDPGDVTLITAIPSEWYPAVPNGNRLLTYDLRFDIPFFDIKNNRQMFKVRQRNVLEEGVMVIQLSGLPVTDNATIGGVGVLDPIFG